MPSQDELFESANCQACGTEHNSKELSTVKLAGLPYSLSVCETCIDKTAEDSFKDAAEIMKDIERIAKSSSDPERSLELIKVLVGK